MSDWTYTQTFAGTVYQNYRFRGNQSSTGDSWLIDNAFPPLSLTLPSAEYLELTLGAWSKFHTQVPESLSLPNFFWELKDLRETLDKFMASAEKIRNQGKPSKDETIRERLGNENSQYLENEFQWKPLQGDIEKILTLSTDLWKRLNWLRKNRGKPVKLHYKRLNVGMDDEGFRSWISDQFPYWDEGLHFYRNGPEFLLRTRFTPATATCEVNYHASCVLLQNLEGLDDNLSVLRSLFGLLGFNNPAKVIWNAIPFSFIADWFLPLGKSLDILAAQPFVGGWDVYNVTHSIEECFGATVESKLIHKDSNPANFVSTSEYKDGKISLSRYTRRMGLPLNQHDVGFSELDAKQQSLFASLIAGNTIFSQSKRS
jgi:hypothetical protein